MQENKTYKRDLIAALIMLTLLILWAVDAPYPHVTGLLGIGAILLLFRLKY
jgi:hypothetical protein